MAVSTNRFNLLEYLGVCSDTRILNRFMPCLLDVAYHFFKIAASFNYPQRIYT